MKQQQQSHKPFSMVSKRKNFLEVLRPHAPVRVWSEQLGEWVEDVVDGGGENNGVTPASTPSRT